MLKRNLLILTIYLAVFAVSFSIGRTFVSNEKIEEIFLAGRTGDIWNTVNNHIETASVLGYDILINGVNKYLNFGSISGLSGYGIRDNSGVLQVKNSGGDWTNVIGASGGISLTDLSNTAIGLTYNNTTGVTSLTSGYEIPKTASTSNWQTAYGWGNHTGLYPTFAYGTSTYAKQASTTNWDTAYSWGNHAGLYDLLGQATSTLSSHTSTYNHTNYNTAYTDRLKWDGGATDLVLATAKTTLGLDTMASLPNTGSTSINTLGTVSTGVWNATAIANDKIASSTEYLADVTWNGSTVANGSITNLTVSGTTTIQSALVDSTGNRGLLNNILISTGTSTRWAIATSTGLLISGGTLTSAYHCRYDGVGLDCDRAEDASGDCGTNAVCMGGHTHSTYAPLANPTFTGIATSASMYVTTGLKIPVSASLSTPLSGFFGGDSTSGQIRFNYGTATSTFSPLLTPSFSVSSTTLTGGAATSTVPLGPAGYGETWSSAICGSVGGTGVGTTTLRFGDNTNWTNTLTVTSTPYDLTLSSNNAFVLAEMRFLQVITTAGSPNYISCTIHKTIDPD